MSHRAFDGYTSTQTANGVDGYETIIRAQNATGTGAKGGNLILGAGTGTSQDGYISFRSGNTELIRISTSGFKNVTVDGYLHVTGNTTLDGYLHTEGDTTLDGYLHTLGNTILDGYLHTKGPYNLFDGYVRTDGYLIVDGYTTIDGYELIFDGYAQAPFIRQLNMPTPGIDGYHLTIRAQNSTTSPARGGDVIIRGGDGYNGDGYTRDGYVKLYSGSSEQARAVPNKFYTLTGQRVNTDIITTSPFDVLDGYFILMVDTSAARTINLPANPLGGDSYKVKDSTGNAGANTITISGNGRNIDGGANHTITTNYGSASFVFNEFNNIWNVI